MKHKYLKISIGAIVLLAVVYLSLPQYAQKALIYLNVGINDYPLFDNREIAANDPIPWELHPQMGRLKMSAEYEDTFMMMNSIAFVIIKDGKLLYEKYWDNYGPNSKTNSFSAAKSMVSFALLKAIDEGYIKSLDQKVYEFIPEMECSENMDLSIRDVMTMSSGLNWKESYSGLFNSTTEAYYGKDLFKLIKDLKVMEEPGKEFKYLSGNTQVLGKIVTNATGQALATFVGEKLWTPMNAEHAALWCLDDKDGLEKAYCCFNSNARDFARWGQLMLDTGKWNGKQLISKSLMEQALTPATHLVDEHKKTVDYYGYQVWILNYNGMQMPYMRGILGQYIISIPEKNMVIVRLGHDRSNEKIGAHPADVFYYVRCALDMAK